MRGPGIAARCRTSARPGTARARRDPTRATRASKPLCDSPSEPRSGECISTAASRVPARAAIRRSATGRSGLRRQRVQRRRARTSRAPAPRASSTTSPASPAAARPPCPAARTAAARRCRGASRCGVRAVATSSAVARFAEASAPARRLKPSGTTRQIRPRSRPLVRSRCFLIIGGRLAGCSIDLAVDVDDVQRAVGRVGELRRAEPGVGRRDELPPLVGALRDEADAVGLEHLAVDDVAADVADERLAAVFGGERVAAVDRDAGRAGEVAGGLPAELRRCPSPRRSRAAACGRPATARRG